MEQIKVTVQIPMKAVWEADVWVPSDRLGDISGYLDEDPDALELIQQNGHMHSDQLLVLEAQLA